MRVTLELIRKKELEIAVSFPADRRNSRQIILVFPLLGLLNLSFFLKYRSCFFNKYSNELCVCVNMEIDTCANNFKTPVLVTTHNIPLQILVAKKFSKFNKYNF